MAKRCQKGEEKATAAVMSYIDNNVTIDNLLSPEILTFTPLAKRLSKFSEL